MLALVDTPSTSWESFMNITDVQKDHAQNRLTATEPAVSARLDVERLPLAAPLPTERTGRAREDFRSRFLTALLSALSTPTV
jgi:hypothetical protein